MANYVTHIAEVKFNDLLEEGAKDFLKAYGHQNYFDDTIYFRYDVPNSVDLDLMQGLAELLNGYPFKVFIFDEDPGNTVGEGLINSQNGLDMQINWEPDYSEMSYAKYQKFKLLSSFITTLENDSNSNRKLTPLGWLSGVVNGFHKNIYVASCFDGKYWVNASPNRKDGWNSKEDWNTISSRDLDKLKSEMVFNPSNKAEVYHKFEIKFSHELIRFDRSNFNLKDISFAKHIFGKVVEHLSLSGMTTKPVQTDLNSLKIDLGDDCYLKYRYNQPIPEIEMASPANLDIRASKRRALWEAQRFLSKYLNSDSFKDMKLKQRSGLKQFFKF